MKRTLVFLAALAGCSAAPPQSDWERAYLASAWQEEEVAPPAYPSHDKLIELKVPEAAGFRFFVDSGTLSVGEDGVVRYVALARSPSGAENVSFEGLRCATREYRIYAVGHPDRHWSGRSSAWQSVGTATARWRTLLQREYFCRNKEPIRDTAEGVRALRKGTPWYRDAD